VTSMLGALDCLARVLGRENQYTQVCIRDDFWELRQLAQSIDIVSVLRATSDGG